MTIQFQFVTDDHRMIGETVERLFADLAAADAAQRLKDGRRLDAATIEDALAGLGLAPGAEPDAMMISAQVQARVAFAAGTTCLAYPVLETLLIQASAGAIDGMGVATDARRTRESVEPDYPLHQLPLSADLRRRANLLAAAEIAGACRTMVRMTRDHLLSRTQFGNVIGSYQALKHRLADAHVDAESLAWTIEYAAAASDGEDAEAPALIAGAKLYAGNAGKMVAEAAMQLHGAIGHTFEYPLHLYMRRVHRLGASFDTRDALEIELLDHFERDGVPTLPAISGES